MKIAALVPMKGNSVRIPGKNTKALCGKPLFWYILDTLERCRSVDKTVVDTDSQEIADMVLDHGFDKVTIQFRPARLCGDGVSVNRLIEHWMTIVEADTYIQTHATNPLLKAETIERTLRGFTVLRPESLFSVNVMRDRLYWIKKGKITPINHNISKLVQTQDLKPVYVENSCFYIFTKKSFDRTKTRLGRNPMPVITDRLESVDINDMADWQIAEALMKERNERL